VVSFLELEPDGAANPAAHEPTLWNTVRNAVAERSSPGPPSRASSSLRCGVRALGPSIIANAALTQPVERRPGGKRLGCEASCALASPASCTSASVVPTLLRSESGPCPLGEQASSSDASQRRCRRNPAPRACGPSCRDARRDEVNAGAAGEARRGRSARSCVAFQGTRHRELRRRKRVAAKYINCTAHVAAPHRFGLNRPCARTRKAERHGPVGVHGGRNMPERTRRGSTRRPLYPQSSAVSKAA
jgi:hypothetical protein